MAPPRVRVIGVVALVLMAVVVLSPAVAVAGPRTPRFGPVIDGYAEHTSPEECKPKAKPGVAAFAEILEEAYPATRWIGIGRACSGRHATSDHHEGRALDWARDVRDRRERRDARELLRWLFATDEHGNADAMARRLGITYVIWDRHIWGTWTRDWSVYCVQKPRGCVDPDSRALLNPHTDHVHISFGWPGARMKTTYWDPEASREG